MAHRPVRLSGLREPLTLALSATITVGSLTACGAAGPAQSTTSQATAAQGTSTPPPFSLSVPPAGTISMPPPGATSTPPPPPRPRPIAADLTSADAAALGFATMVTQYDGRSDADAGGAVDRAKEWISPASFAAVRAGLAARGSRAFQAVKGNGWTTSEAALGHDAGAPADTSDKASRQVKVRITPRDQAGDPMEMVLFLVLVNTPAGWTVSSITVPPQP